MGSHINDSGEFQSDKYSTCPAGKVPLSVKDVTAQDLLWEYAQRRREVDAQFADDLEAALTTAGYVSLGVYRIEDSEKHWVVASTEAEALDLLKDASMIDDYTTVEAYLAEAEAKVVRLPWGEDLLLTTDSGDGAREVRTVGGWCRHHGKGFLGSTVF